MLRLISSLLVMLLGSAATPRGVRHRAAPRPRMRRPHGDAPGGDALEVTERPRARALRTQWRFPGAVVLEYNTKTVPVPGTWILGQMPFHDPFRVRGSHPAADLPDPLIDPVAWSVQLRTILSLQEPRTHLRIGSVDERGWRVLEIARDTQPPSIVHVDRSAFNDLMGSDVTVRFTIQG